MNKRLYCSDCKRTKDACYCSEIKKSHNKTRIIILQHPSESKHPLGTARMAQLSLDHVDILVGEDFNDHRELNDIIKKDSPILVFKTEYSQNLEEHIHKIAQPKTIIFLDGTWKKAKKILFTSTNLQQLNCYHFHANIKSKYTHRKAPKEEYLSTFESIIHILNKFENTSYDRSLEVLDFVMNFQTNKMEKKL